MSFQNRLDQKRLRRFNRLTQKSKAAKLIHFIGHMVTKAMVKGQRYLAMHDMPYSATVAAVTLSGDITEGKARGTGVVARTGRKIGRFIKRLFQ